MALERAFISMAQIPKVIGFMTGVAIEERFMSELEAEGECDLLVKTELERPLRLSWEVKREGSRGCLSAVKSMTAALSL